MNGCISVKSEEHLCETNFCICLFSNANPGLKKHQFVKRGYQCLIAIYQDAARTNQFQEYRIMVTYPVPEVNWQWWNGERTQCLARVDEGGAVATAHTTWQQQCESVRWSTGLCRSQCCGCDGVCHYRHAAMTKDAKVVHIKWGVKLVDHFREKCTKHCVETRPQKSNTHIQIWSRLTQCCVQCMPSADVAASWTLFSRSFETHCGCHLLIVTCCFFLVSLSLIFFESYRRTHLFLVCWLNPYVCRFESRCLLVWFNEFCDVDPTWSFCEIRCVFLVFDPFLSKQNRSKLNLPQQNDQAKKSH